MSMRLWIKHVETDRLEIKLQTCRQTCRQKTTDIDKLVTVQYAVSAMNACSAHFINFALDGEQPSNAEAVGFRLGAKGTHSSRTIMLAELEAVLEVTPTDATHADYASAIIEANCLSKATFATRRISVQRLRELYGLEPKLPLFRVLRRLWAIDPPGRPLLAALTAIARDPLFAATSPAIMFLPAGIELQRSTMKTSLRDVTGDRLNEAILEKACRNAASSWTQSGHLEGRTIKTRRRVIASAPVVAFALYLACAAGFRGVGIFSSAWLRMLDCDPSQGRRLAAEAKRLDLIDLRMADDVVELDTSRLDPARRSK